MTALAPPGPGPGASGIPSAGCLLLPLLAVVVIAGCGGGSSEEETQTAAGDQAPATTTGASGAKHTTGGPYTPGKNAKPDPGRANQYGLDQVKLPTAWKTSGGRVTIAIVDTGVDLGHPDLKGRLVAGHDFVDGGKPSDQDGHGTHVAGIAAAATDNGVGIAGGAPLAKIMPVRVLDKSGSGDTSKIDDGIEWAADHGAKVINLSLGESGLAGVLLRGGSLNQAVDHATRKGAVVVAAAGNDGTQSKPYRASTSVLVVGAVDQNGQPARFSNFGAKDAVVAPGVHVYSTLPTYTVTLSAQYGKGYGYLDGTSMASPAVAAVAALLVAAGRTPQQTIDAIQKTAKKPSGSTDPKLGLGIVDAAAAVKHKGSSGGSTGGSTGTAEPKPKREGPSRREGRGG